MSAFECRTTSGHKWCRDQDLLGEHERNMGDSDKEKSDQEEMDISEQDLEKKIKKEIDKLKFYLEEGDDLLENCDYSEIALTCKRTDEIQNRLNDLMSTLQELKIERGISMQRARRQWKKGPECHIRGASGNENQAELGLWRRENEVKVKKLRKRNLESNSSRRSNLDGNPTREGTLGQKDEGRIGNGKSHRGHSCKAAGAQDNSFQWHSS